MGKSQTKTSSKTTIKIAGTAIKATPVRRRKAAPVAETPVIEAPVAAPAVVETTPVVEVAPVVVSEVAEAPKKAEAVFIIPDLGIKDLVMGREGHYQLPGKAWFPLSKQFGKPTVRKAIDAMVSLEIRLPAALDLVRWEGFRPHMVAQLAAVAANKDTLCVLGWVWNHQGFTWRKAYEAFPRAGFPGCTATKAEIGKLNKLVGLLDKLRKEGKTSERNIDYLAQAVHLIGWIK